MNKPGIHFTLVSFCLSMAGIPGLFGQEPQLYLPDTLAPPGAEIQIAVGVKDLGQVAAIQLGLEWEEEILEFQEVNELCLDSLESSFGLQAVQDGQIFYLWTSRGAEGIQLSDSCLFSILFKIVGNPGARSPLRFVPLPSGPIEVVDTNLLPVQAFLQDGSVKVEAITSLEHPIRENISIYPNPVGEWCIISSRLPGPGVVFADLVSFTGRVIRQHEFIAVKGRNEWRLEMGTLPPGTYFLRLRSREGEHGYRVLTKP